MSVRVRFELSVRVSAFGNSDHPAASRCRAFAQVRGGVPNLGHAGHVRNPHARHRFEDQVRGRAAVGHFIARYGRVQKFRTPTQPLHQDVHNGPIKARIQRNLDPGTSKLPKSLFRSLYRRHRRIGPVEIFHSPLKVSVNSLHSIIGRLFAKQLTDGHRLGDSHDRIDLVRIPLDSIRRQGGLQTASYPVRVQDRRSCNVKNHQTGCHPVRIPQPTHAF